MLNSPGPMLAFRPRALRTRVCAPRASFISILRLACRPQITHMSTHRCCLLCIMLQAITLRSMSRRLSELVQMPCPFARLQSIPAHGFHLELTHRSEHVCSEPRQTWAPPRWNLPSWSPGEFNGSELRKPHASIPATCSSGSRGPAHRAPHPFCSSRAALRLPTRALTIAISCGLHTGSDLLQPVACKRGEDWQQPCPLQHAGLQQPACAHPTSDIGSDVVRCAGTAQGDEHGGVCF